MSKNKKYELVKKDFIVTPLGIKLFRIKSKVKIEFILGSEQTRELCGLHILDEGSASLSEALTTATNKGFDKIYIYNKEMFQNNTQQITTRINQHFSEYTKIKLCIDNLKNTFGVDILKAVTMFELNLTEKDIK